MKKILAFILILVLTVSLIAACAPKETGTDKEETEKAEVKEEKTDVQEEKDEADKKEEVKSYKVSSHNAVVEGNPYRSVYETQMGIAVEDAKKAGKISEFNSYVANNDPATETQLIEQAINDGVDIIIVNPIAASGLDAVIDKAVEAGITYVNADCIYPSDKIVNVIVDQDEWAHIQSQFVIETLGKGGKVVQFNGLDGNSASEIRNERWVKDFQEAGLEVVKTMVHGWSDPEAKKLMMEVINSGLEFDGIINQESANGILDAFEEAKTDFPGCITSSEEVSWIRRIAELNKDEKVLPYIVVENPPGIGATALAVAINLADGLKLKNDTNELYYKPVWIMTYENQAEMLESIKDLPDSTSVSSYMSIEEAKAAYFN